MGFLIRIPRLAHKEIDPMIATGIAINNGQGVATKKTAKKRTASPLITHAKTAMIMAIGVYQAPN
jgi:hypothetical protein